MTFGCRGNVEFPLINFITTIAHYNVCKGYPQHYLLFGYVLHFNVLLFALHITKCIAMFVVYSLSVLVVFIF